MPWGKMDDKAHRNKKVRKLYRMGAKGREAYGVWTFRWSWCLDDPDLDGFVPEDELDAAELRSAEILCSDLHEGRGLWGRVPGGFAFHDFHIYNPTKTQVEDKKAADRERKAGKKPSDPSGFRAESAATPERIPRGIQAESLPTRASPSPSPSQSPSQPNPGGEEAPAPPPPPPVVTLDPGEPDCPPDERVRLRALVRLKFEGAYFAKRTKTPSWTPANVEKCEQIASWLDANGGDDPRAVLDRLVAGFFASARAELRGFPIGFLANDPTEYLIAPPTAPRDVRKGFVAPAPASAFTNPTNLDDVFGPERPRQGAKT